MNIVLPSTFFFVFNGIFFSIPFYIVYLQVWCSERRHDGTTWRQHPYHSAGPVTSAVTCYRYHKLFKTSESKAWPKILLNTNKQKQATIHLSSSDDHLPDRENKCQTVKSLNPCWKFLLNSFQSVRQKFMKNHRAKVFTYSRIL